MSKIYKYTSINSALSILKDNRVLLRNPKLFNDPFDTDAKRSKEDIEEVRKIMEGFTLTTIAAKLPMDLNVNNAIKKDPRFIFVRQQYNQLVDKLRTYPYFDGNFVFSSVYDLLKIKSEFFKEKVDGKVIEIEERINKAVKETKKIALSSCFSKTNGSILMWSHYADCHKGVCLEYERPISSDFVDIVYKEERPKLKFANLVSFISAKAIIGESYDHIEDEKAAKIALEPFITKAAQWSYEEEVRCMLTSTSASNKLTFENGHYYYQMDKPTKILFGCEFGEYKNKQQKNELIALAKKLNIKCVFLKQDDETFSLKEK